VWILDCFGAKEAPQNDGLSLGQSEPLGRDAAIDVGDHGGQ
jgi:hypothetical protein